MICLLSRGKGKQASNCPDFGKQGTPDDRQGDQEDDQVVQAAKDSYWNLLQRSHQQRINEELLRQTTTLSQVQRYAKGMGESNYS